MKQQIPDEDFLRRYLLGELTEDARQRIEDRLLADDEFYEDYLSAEDRVEDALIDQYVGGEMSAGEREKFNQIFLSTPQRFEKLRLVQSLHRYVNSPTPDPQAHSQPQPLSYQNLTASGGKSARWWQSLVPRTRPYGQFAALALVLLVSGICIASLYLKSRRLEIELAALRSQQQLQPTPDQSVQQELFHLRERNDELVADLRRVEEQRALTEQRLSTLEARGRVAAQMKSPSTSSRILTLALPLLNVRSEATSHADPLTLSSDVAYVRLLLGLDTIDPSDYRSFQAEVNIKGGSVVWTGQRLRAIKGKNESQIRLTIPARHLSRSSDYVVRLSGISADGRRSLIGAYDFRVTRE